MNHNPLPFFKLRHDLLFPRILLYQSFGIETLYGIGNLETVRHCLELIEECLLTCVLNEVYGRYFLVTGVIQLPDIHCYLSGKTTLNP